MINNDKVRLKRLTEFNLLYAGASFKIRMCAQHTDM